MVLIQHDPYASLRVKDFLFFLTTRFFLTLAIQMQSVIVGWQVYQITKNVLDLGIIGLAEAIPFIAVSLFSGHIADTYNRKYIIVIFTFLLLVCTSVLFYFSIDNSVFLDKYGVLPIFIVVGCIGVVRGFISPAFPAFMSQLVDRSLYVNSATWNSTVWHIGSIIGPAMAGFICAISFSTAYAVNIILLFIAIFSFLFIKSKPLNKKEQKETIVESLSAGIKFVFKNQIILGALSLDLFAVLFGGAVALLPAFADEILFVGAIELGFMRAAPAFGAVIIAIIIAYKPPTKNAGRSLLLSVAGFGIATIGFALSSNFYLSLFCLFLTGAFDNVSVVIRHTILQLSTPNEMRGRVSAVNSIFIGSSNEIGAFESGVTAKFMGLVNSVVFGGLMTIIVVSITSRAAKKLKNLDIRTIT